MAEHKSYAAARSAASMEIAQRELAYYMWERDGCPDGRAEFYWFRAAEVLSAPAEPAPARRRVKSAAQGAARPAARRARKAATAGASGSKPATGVAGRKRTPPDRPEA